MRKANDFYSIDQAVRFNEPIPPSHDFYTNFTEVRGKYRERMVYRTFGVAQKEGVYVFDFENNQNNRSLFFLGGMRGSGKTTELSKYAENLGSKNCYHVVTCNIDKELSLDDMEFMDILILILEKITKSLKEADVEVDGKAVKSLKKWFESRVVEINKGITGEAGIELGGGVQREGLFSALLGIFGEFKAGVSGSYERRTAIRSTLKNNFMDFAMKFNEYTEEAARAVRKKKKGKQILVIVDGLEKTWTADVRRKIIIDESNRLQQIDLNMIFTLPIELMKERQKIGQFATQVKSFPFIKLSDRKGEKIEAAYAAMREFVTKRIDESLFESTNIIEKCIEYSGGSPRELLKIIERAYFFSSEENAIIEEEALEEALVELANETAQFITPNEWEKVLKVRDNNKAGLDTDYDEVIESLLEKLIVMEYNDGTFKKVNPILTLSNLYKQKIEK